MPSTRRPVSKKRRLLAASPSVVDSLLHVPITPSNVPTPTPVTKASTCTSCHRAFTARPNHLIVCARCRAPTCTICARTCTACPPSAPPTPALSFSPTPPATPLPSPRRSALALHTNTLAFTPGRRRKAREDEEEHVEGEEGCVKDAGAEILPGCGRTICRNCCFESLPSNATTCYDCCGRPYRAAVPAPQMQAQGFDYLQVPLSMQ
ncbi:hypothetical protein B0H21DRAFT_96362 [Amylocystis lapponica]|nr:hypothetical protein B0H21DRAFT_96362 [Amylocystis lapponica]